MDKNDLIDFMQSATNDMAEEYKRIQKRSREDPGTAGDQGEENWATLLRNWLPPTFQIVTKGRIINYAGDTSPQIDILVLRPEYPKHLLDKKLYLAGGVLAALECKVTLRMEHLSPFFDKSIKIKKLPVKRTGTPYRELHSPILYGLLTHSYDISNTKLNAIQNISNKIKNINDEKIYTPLLMPDFICVADLSYWSVHKTAVNNPILYIEEDGTPIIDKERYCQAGYMNYEFSKKNEITLTPIAALITDFLRRLSFEYSQLKSIAHHFYISGLIPSGSGKMKTFDLDFLSREVKDWLIENSHDRQQKWHEWDLTF